MHKQKHEETHEQKHEVMHRQHSNHIGQKHLLRMKKMFGVVGIRRSVHRSYYNDHQDILELVP
jgi:hypothetical protein